MNKKVDKLDFDWKLFVWLLVLLILVIVVIVVIVFTVIAWVQYGNKPIEEIPMWALWLMWNGRHK